MISGFFDSVITGTDSDGNPIYDRLYDADFLTKLIGSVVPNGVTKGSFVPSRGTDDMTVHIGGGSCFINGCFGTSLLDLDFIVPTSSNARRDLFVLRLDTQQRQITLVRKHGTTELTRTSGIYELAVASVLVEANTDRLGENAVTDLRTDADKCGIISENGGGNASFDLGIFSLPANADDTRQNTLVARGADGVISGTAENSKSVGGVRLFVQQNQPSQPKSGDLWLW